MKSHASEIVPAAGTFVGLGVSPGVAIGPAYVYAWPEPSVERRLLADDEVESEAAHFEWTISRAERDLHKILALARKRLGEDAVAIFDAQMLMLRDEALHREVVDRIRGERLCAAAIVDSVLARHREQMQQSGSVYLRERAHDLQDVRDRLLFHLQRGRRISAIEPGTIVVSEVLTAADLLLFSRSGVLGCAFDLGGATSHVSIMARALGLPAVVSAHGITEAAAPGVRIIVDGVEGVVVVDPAPSTLQRYEARRKVYRQSVQADQQDARLPAMTRDGIAICLRANVDIAEEVHSLAERGADGIGLLRTEVFLLDEGMPSLDEESQFKGYQRVVQAVSPEPSTFRLIDLGGDKVLPEAPQEWNPLLGWRGLRVLLSRPEILMPQVRAILRASAFGPARLLLPMVTGVAELRQFMDVLRDASAQLENEGIPHDRDLPVGIMVEVPAVALAADVLARRVAFLSLGTNDLTQYTLAVDRASGLASTLYSEVHPAVLRLIQLTVVAGARHGRPVSLCGELAASARAAPLLIGLGLRELSITPSVIPEIKRVIRGISAHCARELALRALDAEGPEEVEELLDEFHAHKSTGKEIS